MVGFPVSAWALAVLGPLLLALLLLAFQRQLLFPRVKPNAVLHAPTHRIRSVQIDVPGARLQAWLAEPEDGDDGAGKHDATRRGVLYFNGRREHPTSIFRCLHAMPGVRVLAFHYRGLGLSWRKPGEAQLVADALAVLEWLQVHGGLAAGDITIAGRSLGSGIAVAVAAARPVRQLVLISPFERLLSAVRVRLPFVRGWMLKDHFCSVDHMPHIPCTVLLVLGERDRTVPPVLSRQLLAHATGAWQEYALPDMGHRGLLRDARVQQRLAAFCR